ncbi:MAG: sulfoxide reductase heme-binding subunit YedZ [Polyangiaceae bacterium]|nr:sulfoxide reductase heme-binding subunit YedZ [Polyangiaceae bacterium]
MAIVETPAKRGAKGKLGWLVPAITTGGLLPLVVLVARYLRRDLGANPIAEALNQLGLLGLLLLLLSLAATPLQVVTHWKWPIRIRKSLGLLGFFYVCLHFLLYAVVDQSLALGPIVEDIAKRPFILVGFLGFVLLIPMAMTSTAKALKTMGFVRWKRLHRLAYVVGVLGIVHYIMRVKKVTAEPLIYASVLGGLFVVRIVDFFIERAQKKAIGQVNRP